MAAEPESPEQLYDLAQPDPEHTLGGIKDDIEPDHPSVIGHIVKSLMPGQDLTRVTIPSFFLEPRSLLERMADTQMHPDLLLGVADLPDPVARMMAIVKWYLSGWHYKTVGVKKPFNPIVGETFACYWKHADGSRSQYFAEQVSHRPPISGIYFENRRHNVVASSHVWTKSQFSAPQTTKSILDGACVLKLTNRGPETYYITFPTYYAHNLLLGTLRMEVGDVGHIVCEATGLRADIEFTQKPMFGGADRLNGVNGVIKRTGASAKELFHVTGHWDSVMYIALADARASKEVLLDVGAEVVSPKHVLPLELQGPWESRRLWRWAASELAARPVVNWSAVDREKAQLEEEQRLLPCHHHGHGRGSSKEHTEGWETKRFHKKTVRDPLAGTDRELYVFDGMVDGTPYTAGEPESNMLELSRTLPDPRGGLKGAGAVASVVEATKSVTLSTRRAESFEKF